MRTVRHFGLHLGGLWASFGDFFDDFFDLGKRVEKIMKKGHAESSKEQQDGRLLAPKKDKKGERLHPRMTPRTEDRD